MADKKNEKSEKQKKESKSEPAKEPEEKNSLILMLAAIALVIIVAIAGMYAKNLSREGDALRELENRVDVLLGRESALEIPEAPTAHLASEESLAVYNTCVAVAMDSIKPCERIDGVEERASCEQYVCEAKMILGKRCSSRIPDSFEKRFAEHIKNKDITEQSCESIGFEELMEKQGCIAFARKDAGLCETFGKNREEVQLCESSYWLIDAFLNNKAESCDKVEFRISRALCGAVMSGDVEGCGILTDVGSDKPLITLTPG